MNSQNDHERDTTGSRSNRSIGSAEFIDTSTLRSILVLVLFLAFVFGMLFWLPQMTA